MNEETHEYTTEIEGRLPESDVTVSFEDLIVDFKRYIEDGDTRRLLELIEDVHTFDQYKLFRELNDEERRFFYAYVPVDVVAGIFAEFDSEEQIKIFSELDGAYVSKLMGQMDADDAADLISELPQGEAAAYLSQMEKESAADIKELLIYDDETAGSKMTKAYIAVESKQTAKEALRQLVQKAPDAETIYTIYVIDTEGCLEGVLSLKDLILARANEVVEDVMTSRVISVRVDEHQEQVAKLIQDYDLTAIPVVDQNDYMLGIITVDDVIDVIKEEAEDDYLKMAGIGEADDTGDDFKVLPSLKIRLPWLVSMVFLEGVVVLILTLMNNVTSAQYTESFVALIMPAIVLVNNMSGVPGIQTAALAIVHYNSGELDDKKQERLFFSVQSVVILLSGIAIGLSAFFVALFVNALLLSDKTPSKVFGVSLAVGIAATLASYISSFTALQLVRFLKKRNLDPAAASGPLMSTLGDVISAVIYTTVSVVIIVFVLRLY